MIEAQTKRIKSITTNRAPQQSDHPSSTFEANFNKRFQKMKHLFNIRNRGLILKLYIFAGRHINKVKRNIHLVASVELVNDQPSHLTLDEDTRTQC